MNTKALRQKILDLAIHGKLVPQDPNDEPASVLLERIRDEKERLIKEGKIKRPKKSKTTSDKPHYPYQLPERWKWCKLEDIAELIEDCPHSTAKDEGQGFALIRTPNIGIGHLIFDNVHRVSKEVYDIRNARAVPQINDIIYAREAPAGNAAIINDKEKVCLGQRTVLIRPMQKWIDSMWLTYTINSPYARKTLISKATGSTVTHVNMENIRSLALPLPPLQEQSRIVESIEHWLSLVDCIEESNNNLQEAIRQTKSKILDLAIHGKLVPQDPTDEPASELLKRINPKAEIISDNGHYQKLPEGWCMTNIGSLFDAVSAKRVLKSEWKDKGVPFYRAREIVQLSKEGFADKDLFISEEYFAEIKDKYGIPAYGDIMISAVGSIGYTYIVKENDVFYYKDASVLCLKNTRHWNSKFFSICLASPFLQEQMYKNSKGTTVDTITLEKLKGYVIPFPPLNEQDRIVSKIEEIFAQLDAIEASL